ncbi:hypothetical protein EE36_15447 [Sulfitobacter sp. EE-36]|nr:hypothetical protein EE36_15447 [Sulfitobacter sp. EE-36]
MFLSLLNMVFCARAYAAILEKKSVIPR